MAMIKGRFITVILLLLFLSICFSSSAHADQWAKLYGWGGDKDEDAHCIQQTSDGGYIVAGAKFSWGAGYYSTDALVFKLDGNGQLKWKKIYGGTGSDHAGSVQQTSDGGYIV